MREREAAAAAGGALDGHELAKTLSVHEAVCAERWRPRTHDSAALRRRR
jgi:hypothetical protein